MIDTQVYQDLNTFLSPAGELVDSLREDRPPPPPNSKPGFFRRLFGSKQSNKSVGGATSYVAAGSQLHSPSPNSPLVGMSSAGGGGMNNMNATSVTTVSLAPPAASNHALRPQNQNQTPASGDNNQNQKSNNGHTAAAVTPGVAVASAADSTRSQRANVRPRLGLIQCC